MTETDFRYVLLRLNYKRDQLLALALHRMLVQGYPLGPAARSYGVPPGRLERVLPLVKEIERHFTVTDEEANGLTPNELLAYVRSREVAEPEVTGVVTASQLRAAGLTDDQIQEILK